MIKVRLYNADGQYIEQIRQPRLFDELVEWYKQNIYDNEFRGDFISSIEFKDAEDYNLFRLCFAGKLHIVKDVLE
jgi:hypothetical protein